MDKTLGAMRANVQTNSPYPNPNSDRCVPSLHHLSLLLSCLHSYFTHGLSRFLNASTFQNLNAYEGAAWLHSTSGHYTVCLEAGTNTKVKHDGFLTVSYARRGSKSCSGNGEPPAYPQAHLHETSHPATSHAEGSHPETTHVEGSHPETTHVEGSHPATSHVEGSHPETTHVEGLHPETTHAEGSHPETTHVEGSHPETSHPESTPHFTAPPGRR